MSKSAGVVSWGRGGRALHENLVGVSAEVYNPPPPSHLRPDCCFEQPYSRLMISQFQGYPPAHLTFDIFKSGYWKCPTMGASSSRHSKVPQWTTEEVQTTKSTGAYFSWQIPTLGTAKLSNSPYISRGGEGRAWNWLIGKGLTLQTYLRWWKHVSTKVT